MPDGDDDPGGERGGERISVTPDSMLAQLKEQRNSALDQVAMISGALDAVRMARDEERAAWQAERALLVKTITDAGLALPATTELAEPEPEQVRGRGSPHRKPARKRPAGAG